jgi:hypothetical protein
MFPVELPGVVVLGTLTVLEDDSLGVFPEEKS